MQGQGDDLGALAQHASAALRRLLTAAETEVARMRSETERIEPPPELFGLVRTLDNWTQQLRGGE